MTRRTLLRLPARARGFTLIELMVVAVVIALLVSAAVIGLGNNAQRRLDEEAARFASLVRLASDEAVLGGREIGLQIEETGYSFFAFDDQMRTWIAMPGDAVFRQRKMNDAIRLELFLDDLEMQLPGAAEEDDNESPASPQILLLSSGEITPFELAFEFEEIEGKAVLRVHPNGELEILGRDES